MRTVIQGGWVVGFGGDTHTLIRDGVVVFKDDRIVHVGANYSGPADREIDARGKLVSPGFIDTHVHSGHWASQRLITDTGRREYFGQPFLEVSAPREGTAVVGDPRWREVTGWPTGGKPGENVMDEALQLHATFTVAEMLRNGTTTFMEFGSGRHIQDALKVEVTRLGTRAYLGAGYDLGRWVTDEKGRLKRVLDEKGGWRAFEDAKEFIRLVDGDSQERIRGILLPTQVDTCSPELLEASREAARELNAPIATHACYHILEYFQVMREHGMTPIELLDSVGMLGPDLIIGHCNFVADNPMMHTSASRDLELIAESGASVGSCPVNLARRARYLDHWDQYRKAGINLTLGTDTYPRDLIMNMRVGSYVGKIMGHDLFHATAAHMFEAATLGGARALGRDDLGRLAPGAKADIIIIDLSGRETLRYRPILDPIKSLVECGIGDDVETAIVDGNICMENRRIPGVDLDAVGQEAQEAGEMLWAHVHEWDPLGRTTEERAPWSFPLMS